MKEKTEQETEAKKINDTKRFMQDFIFFAENYPEAFKVFYQEMNTMKLLNNKLKTLKQDKEKIQWYVDNITPNSNFTADDLLASMTKLNEMFDTALLGQEDKNTAPDAQF